MDEREKRSTWMMAAMATLIAGKSVQEATRNADQVTAAYESRFKTEEHPGRPTR